jgi:probable F420-dependent oxidoreductase
VKFGVTFSPREIGNDPQAIRDWAQAVEGAGFDHVLSAEHVIGGHPDRLKEGERLHTYDVVYRDPFVLFGFIAGATRNLEMVTSILILPQRQTVLVAKQAADLDLMTNGRLRLGVGLGRNYMEYEVLNENFHNRGRRVEEQIEVLRKLWTEELVTYQGRWHNLDRMGLNPMPVQRPIPIWMGTFTQIVENAIKRVARIADGWFPQFPPNDEFKAVLERFRGYAKEAGRDPKSIGIEMAARCTPKDNPEDWMRHYRACEELGATHLRVGVGDAGSLQETIDTLSKWRETVTR